MKKASSRSPRKSCDDPNCPFHGSLRTRGRFLDGRVISAKMDKTAIIGLSYLHYQPKYKRYERRHSNIPAHNPPCLDIREGDRVKIAECRPLAKTVAFVVLEKLEEK